jgi:hypothetical protein
MKRTTSSGTTRSTSVSVLDLGLVTVDANQPPVGISKITMDEARPLKNHTVPMDDEGHYIVTLDVFHQLHCLVCFLPFWN